ncbi:MAG TPA: PDZ domain-containing protein [Gemmataceae bacterium]|nr:PDZ domain-containing protein [Gemmataceae bacterium]
MFRKTFPARAALLPVLIGLGVFPMFAQQPSDEDVAALQEKVLREAILKVAPSIVQIETSGGTDLIGSGPMGPRLRKGVGPTTGVVAAADGYIISSAFNFANKPTAIFVAVPGHANRYPAKEVATDQTRMLTLLKIDAAGLQVPRPAPKKEIKVGQSALALGRTWSGIDQPPSVSYGIISALDRIWGKALQTDGKVSPVNYGGPLVDIQGRVMGVLVPASPQGQDEIAGVEWYDSGIGFAIPMEDVNAALDRLKQGKDLKPGMLGITPQNQQDPYGAIPVIGSVLPKSAAALAGIMPGDTILEINGFKVVRYNQVKHILGPTYEGDIVSVKIKRGSEEKSFPEIKLTGTLPALAQPFLGILPMRDDPELGVQVRYVYAKSPAEAAGIKPGDRVLSIGRDKIPQPFSGREELVTLLGNILPGSEVKVEVQRPEVKDLLTLTLRLADVPDTIPDSLPEPATLKKALEPRKQVKPKQPMPLNPPMEPKKEEKKDPDKKPETGLQQRSNAARDHNYWVYVPDNYDPNISYALLIWLHAPGKAREKEKDAEAMVDLWDSFCEENHIIMVGPKAQNESGWLASESDFVRETINSVAGEYTVDRQRIVAHGMDSGGMMAYRMGLVDRDLVRGVVTTGAVMPMQPGEAVSNQRLAFFIITGDKDPQAKLITESKDKLIEMKYPVVFRQIPNMGHQYPGPESVKEIARWIDSLDRE